MMKAMRRSVEPRWWTLVAICGATFILLVDVTIVQVALPTIQRRLGAGFTDLQWVIDGYALTLAAFILTCGSLADRYGRKLVFVGGVAVFTSASILCGLASSASLLIAARALQGFGGAAMFATGLALIAQEFEGAERAKAIATWGATVGVAVALGPLLGGALTDAFGWRWIFFVNAPVGVLIIALSLTRMTNVSDPGTKRLDIAGVVTFSGSLFLLVFALLRGNTEGWGSTLIVSMLAGGALLMLAFVAVESLQSRPMLDLSLFRKPGFTGVSLSTFAIGAGMFAMFPYITFYLQNELGYSPFAGGVRLLPCTLLCFAVPIVTRGPVHRLPARVALGAGLAFTALGLAAMTGLTVGSTWTALIAGMVLTGVGIGISNPSIARIALGVVAPQRSGMASGISNTFRIAGLASGVAALGALFQHRIASSLAAQLGHPVPNLATAVASEGTRAAAGHPGLIAAAQHAFVDGMNEILVVGAVLTAIGAAIGFALVRARDFQQAAAATPAAPTPESALQASH